MQIFPVTNPIKTEWLTDESKFYFILFNLIDLLLCVTDVCIRARNICLKGLWYL